MKPAAEAVLVGARVDWLEVTFRVAFDGRALSMLKRRGAESIKLDAPTTCELAGRPYKLTMPRQGRWLLQDPDARLLVLERGPGSDPVSGAPGWGVTLTYSGTALQALGWREAIRQAWDVCEALGEVLEGRIGRTDLCADVAHYRLREEDRWDFIKQRRVALRPIVHDGIPVLDKCKVVRDTSGEEQKIDRPMRWKLDARKVVALMKDDGDGVVAEHYSGGTFTGFAFGSRTTVSARIYDKRHQLRAQCEDKREAEEAEWRGHGWDGKSSVTRVEFEFRGEALDELRMRHPTVGAKGPELLSDAFGSALDGAWSYATHKWLRLAKRGDAAMTQQRWRVVQSAVFVKAEAPRARVRERGAAKAAQARGSMFSLCGALGTLPAQRWLPGVDPTTGEVDEQRCNADESVLVEEFTARVLDGDEEGAAERAGRAVLAELAATAAAHVWDAELHKCKTAKKALARVWAHQRATMARFPRKAAAPLPFAIVAA